MHFAPPSGWARASNDSLVSGLATQSLGSCQQQRGDAPLRERSPAIQQGHCRDGPEEPRLELQICVEQPQRQQGCRAAGDFPGASESHAVHRPRRIRPCQTALQRAAPKVFKGTFNHLAAARRNGQRFALRNGKMFAAAAGGFPEPVPKRACSVRRALRAQRPARSAPPPLRTPQGPTR